MIRILDLTNSLFSPVYKNGSNVSIVGSVINADKHMRKYDIYGRLGFNFISERYPDILVHMFDDLSSLNKRDYIENNQIDIVIDIFNYTDDVLNKCKYCISVAKLFDGGFDNYTFRCRLNNKLSDLQLFPLIEQCVREIINNSVNKSEVIANPTDMQAQISSLKSELDECKNLIAEQANQFKLFKSSLANVFAPEIDELKKENEELNKYKKSIEAIFNLHKQ